MGVAELEDFFWFISRWFHPMGPNLHSPALPLDDYALSVQISERHRTLAVWTEETDVKDNTIFILVLG